ncbi:MAG: peptidase inhibitor family I36 protein [Propioniciclava sp.]
MAALNQCYKSGAVGCGWNDTNYRSSFYAIPQQDPPSPFRNYSKSACSNPLFHYAARNKFSSYRNNTIWTQTLYTKPWFRGRWESMKGQTNYPRLRFNNNHESMRGFCSDL